jgi:uncharacterized membrane protein YqjE
VTDGNGVPPPGTAEKSLGDIVGEVSEKATLLVREEIELAKAEVVEKVSSLIKGAVVGIAAGIFAVFALIYLLHGAAFIIWDALSESGTTIWLGYFIVGGGLLLLGGLAGFIAARAFKKGAPPTPQLAIEEAKRTKAEIEEARR